jgi:hypothetical protein
VTCWEIATYGAVPYAKVKLVDVKDQVLGGLRPPHSKGFPESMYAITIRCWDADPKARPKFAQVYAEMVAAGKAEVKKGGKRGTIRDVGALVRGSQDGRATEVAQVEWALD